MVFHIYIYLYVSKINMFQFLIIELGKQVDSR